MKPWHGQLVAAWFAAGPDARIEAIAKKLGKTVAACQLALKSEACQAELGRYQAAVRAHLVARRVAPLEKLAQHGEAAVDGLVGALQLATERENVREMRECSVAILAHLGMGPVKKVDKTMRPGEITDPEILRRMLAAERPSTVLLELEGTAH